ncbi:N-formylglutamate amidohydrolase [Roseovarius litorisediminis]|uniref:N-formylglutamate amidohydrolase n=1 Tax=Roseovarius litorisediminis TaxID=1312363 RepID=A0A1Y5RZ57_9RHOB|nr:N-formylglutamate amidohydrolase [Roseovarius litorisediminis]SLN28783.1 N-formylglutamate amidohydrolase [Roseovarius litorisediminis]
MHNAGWPPAAVFGIAGTAPVVLVCEHASDFIPPEFSGLGLAAGVEKSHAAWDIGALDVSKCLSARLSAPLVAGQVSRLVYDCNRPLEAPDCIPAKSEIFEIPGNRNLSDADKQARFETIHSPFHETIGWVLDRQIPFANAPVLLITIHSFTPIYNGKKRELDLGYLFHSKGKIANSAVSVEKKRGVMRAAVNEPYAASDGVTYTLAKHAEARGLDSVMIEIRNDMIDTPEKAERVAGHLAETLGRVDARCKSLEGFQV